MHTGKAVSRVGFAVSKMLGTAVTRNKVRRRLKAIVQELKDEFSPLYDAVIAAKRSAVVASFAQLNLDLRCTLVKSGLLAGAAEAAGCGEEHA